MSNVWTWPPQPQVAGVTPASVRAALFASGSVPLWLPPATPDAFDDEFDSTTLNSAWLFRDMTALVNRTPNVGAFDENVTLTGLTTPPNVSLHTQGRRSWMNIQTTFTGPVIYLVYKPFTFAPGKVWWCRAARMMRKVGVVATTGTYNLTLWASSGGVPDNNNRAILFWDLLNGNGRWTILVGGVSSQVAFNIPEGLGTYPYAAILNPAGILGAGASWYGEFFDDDGRRLLPTQPGNASFPWTPAYIGWQIQQDFSNPSTFAVDFIRQSTGHPLTHNTNI